MICSTVMNPTQKEAHQSNGRNFLLNELLLCTIQQNMSKIMNGVVLVNKCLLIKTILVGYTNPIQHSKVTELLLAF